MSRKTMVSLCVTGLLVLAGIAALQVALAQVGAEADRTLNGGAAKRIRIRTDDSPRFTISDAFVLLPGATVQFSGPSSGTDLAYVTFSGECGLDVLGGGVADDFDSVIVNVRLDGDSLGSTIARTGSGISTHSAQYARRVGAGTHTLEVFWRLDDTSTDQSLNARMRVSALSVQVHE